MKMTNDLEGRIEFAKKQIAAFDKEIQDIKFQLLDTNMPDMKKLFLNEKIKQIELLKFEIQNTLHIK